MPGQNSELARRLQRAIERIKGVTSVHIVLDEQGEIAEIHLEGLPTRRPKQIVRDTESLLLTRFGIHVDYRRISLVQLVSEGSGDSRARLRFISARQDPQSDDRVQVILRSGTEHFEGLASVSSYTQGELDVRATADATLGAVQKAIGPVTGLQAQDVRTVAADQQQVCLVIISASTPRGDERLTGTCIVDGNVLEAAAKATLDAINRRLPVWLVNNESEASKSAVSSTKPA